MKTPMQKEKSKKKLLMYYLAFGCVLYLYVCLCIFHYSALSAVRSNRDKATFGDAMTDVFLHPTNIKITGNGLLWCLMVFGGTAIFLFVRYDDKSMRKHDDPNTVTGTAKLMDSKELNEYNMKFSAPIGELRNDGPENTIISEEIRLSIDGFKTRRNINMLVLGGSGAGKTRFFIGPNIMQLNCNFIITDPSGELVADYGKLLEDHGYKVSVFNLVDMYSSSRYNPFKYIHKESDAFIVVDTFMKNTKDKDQKGGDQFWDDSVKLLLEAIILYIWHMCPKEEQTFNKVLELLKEAEINENSTEANALDQKMQELANKDPKNLAVNQYRLFKLGGDKTLKNILVSVGTRMQAFALSDIGYLTSKDNIDIEHFADSPQAIFVIIPQTNDTFNFLVAMFYTQVFETLYNYGDTRVRYGWKLKTNDYRTALKTIQANSWSESEIARKQIEKIFNEIKGGKKNIIEVNNKKRKLVEFYTKKFINPVLYDKYGSVEIYKANNKKEATEFIANINAYNKNKEEVIEQINKKFEKSPKKATKYLKALAAVGNRLPEIVEIDGSIVVCAKYVHSFKDDQEYKQFVSLSKLFKTDEEEARKQINEIYPNMKDEEDCIDAIKTIANGGIQCKKNKNNGRIYIYTRELISWRGNSKALVDDFYNQMEVIKMESGKKDKQKIPNHVRFLLDEFANIGQIPEFEKKLSTVRKYEISCSIIIQALSQLKDLYKDNFNTIIGNCDTALFLGSRDIDSVEWIIKSLGKRTTTVESMSFQGNGNGSTSYNKNSIELLTTDQIMMMQDNECLVVMRGVRPYYGPKFDIEKHRNYRYSTKTSGTFVIEAEKVGKIDSDIPVSQRENILSINTEISEAAKNMESSEENVKPISSEDKANIQKAKNNVNKKKASEWRETVEKFDENVKDEQLSKEMMGNISATLSLGTPVGIKECDASVFEEIIENLNLENAQKTA